MLARPFDPVLDWGLFGDAESFLRDSAGEAGAIGAVIGVVGCFAIALALLPLRAHTPNAVMALALVIPVLIAAVIGGLPVYVRPQIDPLRHADAIFILGGYGDLRYSCGLELGLQGWAPAVVASNPHGKDDPWLTACLG